MSDTEAPSPPVRTRPLIPGLAARVVPVSNSTLARATPIAARGKDEPSALDLFADRLGTQATALEALSDRLGAVLDRLDGEAGETGEADDPPFKRAGLLGQLDWAAQRQASIIATLEARLARLEGLI